MRAKRIDRGKRHIQQFPAVKRPNREQIKKEWLVPLPDLRIHLPGQDIETEQHVRENSDPNMLEGPASVTISSSFSGRFPCSSVSATPPNGKMAILLTRHEKYCAATACPISWMKMIANSRMRSWKRAVTVAMAATTRKGDGF